MLTYTALSVLRCAFSILHSAFCLLPSAFRIFPAAISTTDEVIATQRCCHEIPSLVSRFALQLLPYKYAIV
jgi:hypothetical protein